MRVRFLPGVQSSRQSMDWRDLFPPSKQRYLLACGIERRSGTRASRRGSEAVPSPKERVGATERRGQNNKKSPEFSVTRSQWDFIGNVNPACCWINIVFHFYSMITLHFDFPICLVPTYIILRKKPFVNITTAKCAMKTNPFSKTNSL